MKYDLSFEAEPFKFERGADQFGETYDGTEPEFGSSRAASCPHCGQELYEIEQESPEARPAFRFACPGGCIVGGHARTEAQCRRILFGDLALALRFANRAAELLEAMPRATRTNAIYTRVFGHNPSRPVPWAGNSQSGAITARRFRMVASALERRVIHFDCGTRADANAEALVNAATRWTGIRLHPAYWATANQAHRAAMIVHETMHGVFVEFLFHQRDAAGNAIEVRRINAHCYEALVLLLNNRTPVTFDVDQCRGARA